MQGLGFAKGDTSGKLSLTAQGLQAMDNPQPHRIIKQFFKKWLDSSYDELGRISNLKGQTGKGQKALVKPSARRSVLTLALKECAQKQWIRISDFMRFLSVLNYGYQVVDRSNRSAWNLYVCEPEHGSLGYSGDNSAVAEGPYLRCLFFEYLAVLGLVDICYSAPDGVLASDFEDHWGVDDLSFYSRYDGLYAFKLNEFGKYCLGLTESYSPTFLVKPTMVVLQDNLELSLIDGKFSIGERTELSLWAKEISDLKWCLSLDQCLESLENGKSAHSLREFLTERTDCEFPESVENLIAKLENQGNSLRHEDSAQLFSCRDAGLMARLTSDKNASKYCIVIDKETFLVQQKNQKKFHKALRDLGLHFPPVLKH
jgi:hypothetical protein